MRPTLAKTTEFTIWIKFTFYLTNGVIVCASFRVLLCNDVISSSTLILIIIFERKTWGLFLTNHTFLAICVAYNSWYPKIRKDERDRGDSYKLLKRTFGPCVKDELPGCISASAPSQMSLAWRVAKAGWEPGLYAPATVTVNRYWNNTSDRMSHKLTNMADADIGSSSRHGSKCRTLLTDSECFLTGEHRDWGAFRQYCCCLQIP